MFTHKKRKISSIGSSELCLAIKALSDLKNSLVHEDETPAEQDAYAGDSQTLNTSGRAQKEKGKSRVFDDQLAGMTHLMKSRITGSQTFTGMLDQKLQDDMQITFLGFLVLKNRLEIRIHETTLLGEDQLWSSNNMYRHLVMLEGHISRTPGASARAWIDTFFFRAIAMVPPTRRMMFSTEYTVHSTSIRPQKSAIISGRTNYTAVVTKPDIAGALLTSTQRLSLQKYITSGLVVVEGKSGQLTQYIPQAVAEIYGCAKTMQKDILRGALTNGREWIFLIVYCKKDGDEASYKETFVHTFDVLQTGEGSTVKIDVIKPKPDLIAGILSYWIEHSFDDILMDDWFMDYDEQ